MAFNEQTMTHFFAQRQYNDGFGLQLVETPKPIAGAENEVPILKRLGCRGGCGARGETGESFTVT
jgi:hypothetical protein